MDEVPLSIVVTVVSGGPSLRSCLEGLQPQAEAVGAEILVPFDSHCGDVPLIVRDFTRARAVRAEESPQAVSDEFEHRRYDRRRAAGLRQCRGRIIAMTEDHALPAADWCCAILDVHRAAHAVIGGAIDNGADRTLNWAQYYCDFGRYGPPLAAGEAEYVSDVNVSYKRDALFAARDVWEREYHETTVHWTLRDRGYTLWLNPRLVVSQHRPPMAFARALCERFEWGRVFAETRAGRCGIVKRVLLALGMPLLPFLLTARVIGHMRRQGRFARQWFGVVPMVWLLQTGWSLGEFAGTVAPQQADVDK